MSQINVTPSAQDTVELSKAFKYHQSYDTIETWSAINSTAAINCSGINVGSTAYIPTINTGTIMCHNGASMKMMSGVSITGDLTLEQPKAYVDFYERMMQAVYGSTDGEKDQEFCMPSTKSKKYLGQLLTHMNDEDSERVLRILYYALSNPTTMDLPSKQITTSILEFAVKENL